MLHRKRARLEEMAKREDAGESLWTDGFSANTRRRLEYALCDPFNTFSGGESLLEALSRIARQQIIREEGLASLSGGRYDVEQPAADLWNFFFKASDDWMPTLIEALVGAMRSAGLCEPDSIAVGVEPAVNGVFLEDRVSFELIDGVMVERKSQELHATIVAPALRLLSGRAGWDAVEDSYQKAIKEISADPGDAITDVGTAMQEAFRNLGCSGRDLAHLSADAVRKGILKGFDSKIIEWIGADRSQSGDGHTASTATPEDAWLAVHVGGALILRLASGGPRTATT